MLNEPAPFADLINPPCASRRWSDCWPLGHWTVHPRSAGLRTPRALADYSPIDLLPPDCCYPWLFASGPFASRLFLPVSFRLRTICPLMFLPVTVHFRTIGNRTVPTRDVLLPDHLLWITCPRPGLFILWTIKWSPFCACAVHNVDHLPPGSSYYRSVAPGLFIRWTVHFVPGLFIL